MNDFDEEKKNEQSGEYGQNNNSSYYTPPQNEQNNGTTYHYSYTGSQQNAQNTQSTHNTQNAQNTQSTHNTQNAQNTQYTQNAQNTQYTQNAQSQTNGGYYQGGNYYTPPHGNYSAQQSRQAQQAQQSHNQNGEKPPKKHKTSKAGKIVAVILVICVAVAVAGIALTTTGVISSDSSSETTTSQSDSSDDVKTNESNDVATQDSDGNLTVAGVAQKVMDSCVGITVYSQQQDAYSYFYGDSSSDSSSEESGEGSGIIMSEKDGKTYILTCAHVISDGSSFTVTLNNKEEYDASLVAYDSQTDIGVLSIDATGLQTAEFADSDNLAVGEQVIAIGCPGGLEFMNSVTSGYISALDRPISSSIGYNNKCIQVDAAINPGNSGGALFNMQGQVIGVNSSKIAATEYEGMGFAVPSDTAVSVANSLIKSGYVEGRAKIGITYNVITNYSNYSTILSALEEKGYKDAEGTMVIDSVDGSSDLASKDIKQYDMIVAVNGTTMTSTDVLTSILADSKPGDTIKLTIARIENNQITTKDVECKLMESKSSSSSTSSDSSSNGID